MPPLIPGASPCRRHRLSFAALPVQLSLFVFLRLVRFGRSNCLCLSHEPSSSSSTLFLRFCCCTTIRFSTFVIRAIVLLLIDAYNDQTSSAPLDCSPLSTTAPLFVYTPPLYLSDYLAPHSTRLVRFRSSLALASPCFDCCFSRYLTSMRVGSLRFWRCSLILVDEPPHFSWI
jgi:hypothetical protein